MKFAIASAIALLTAAPVLADGTSAITHFNGDRDGSEVVVLLPGSQTVAATRDAAHSPRAQAIFARIDAEDDSDED